jgi:hypothetical protein
MRFEQLEPGDLFVFSEAGTSLLAMKTAVPASRDRNNLVLLGPEFPHGAYEAFLLPWQPATVVSFSKDFSVLLPTDPSAWTTNGTSRDPVCLALCEEKIYICANGGGSPQHFFQCFVELGTGAIVEGRLRGSPVYTGRWELALLSPNHPPRSFVKYPLQPK